MKTILGLVALLASSALVPAQTYNVMLNAAQDGGGARAGSGIGTLTLAGTALTFNNILFSGLSGNVTVAHIHGPAGPGPAGTASPLYNLHGTFLPTGGTSGAINGTLNLVAGTGGFDLPTQFNQLNNGMWYVNIHTTLFGGGEIRGQVMPVPEPATWAIGVLGLAGMVWMRRRPA